LRMGHSPQKEDCLESSANYAARSAFLSIRTMLLT